MDHFENNLDEIKLPHIVNYIAAQNAVLEEFRKRKLEAISKQYPDKRIFVTKDNQVFIQK